MKKMLSLLLALACTVFSFAQEDTDNLYVHEGNLIWQKVYTTDMSLIRIADALIASGKVMDLTYSDDNITCRLVPAEADWKKCGYTVMNVPECMAAADVNAFVTIQVKEGRYRVTAEELVLVFNRRSGLYVKDERLEFDAMLLKKGEMRRNAGAKSVCDILNKHLDSIFGLEKKSHLSDDNW